MYEPYKRAWEKLSPQTTNDEFKKIMQSLPRRDRVAWQHMQTLYRQDAVKFAAFAEERPYLYLLAGAEPTKKKIGLNVPYGSKPQKNKSKYEPKKPRVQAQATPGAAPTPAGIPKMSHAEVDRLLTVVAGDVPAAPTKWGDTAPQ
jgi:hypothetical protein